VKTPLKRFAKVLIGADLFTCCDVSEQTLRLGSNYGGWEILADALPANAIVYSFGVGEDISFDLELIRRYGVTVHAFDPTARSIKWVRAQPVPSQFLLHEIGVSSCDGFVAFSPPANPEHVSYSVFNAALRPDAVDLPVRRVRTIMADLEHSAIDLLKMDIEGAEYAVIDDLLETGVYPTQVLIEFHHRLPGIGARCTARAIRQLRARGYKLFAVSPSGEEYSFVLRPNTGPKQL
jgi:FkbM family methyltransferase